MRRSGAWPSASGETGTRAPCGSGRSTRRCSADGAPPAASWSPRGWTGAASPAAPRPAPTSRHPSGRGDRTPAGRCARATRGGGRSAQAAAARRALQAHTCRECRKRRPGGYNRGRGGGSRPTHISEELLAEARRLYAGGPSLRQVAAELHPRTGYKTVASCAEALYGHFKRRGWKLRPQREVTAARNHKHGRKARQQTRAQQNAYRRWLAEQRGWSAVQGPGRPLCQAVKLNPPGKGRPCRRHALADSEYCYSHDPRRALERQAATARMRSKVRRAPLLAQAA